MWLRFRSSTPNFEVTLQFYSTKSAEGRARALVNKWNDQETVGGMRITNGDVKLHRDSVNLSIQVIIITVFQACRRLQYKAQTENVKNANNLIACVEILLLWLNIWKIRSRDDVT